MMIRLSCHANPHLWDGPLAKRLEGLKADLTDNWSTKQRGALVTECLAEQEGELSEKEYILFQWMCIHITLGGTPTKNPHPDNVFHYLHHALNHNSDFVFN